MPTALQRALFSALVCIVTAAACPAQSIPSVKAKALDNSEVVLPQPGSSQVLILITGFSHKSADSIEAWGKHVSADFRGNDHVTYFELPNLQGVPGLVKPMILHGMHKDVPEAQYPHFAPIYNDKSAWQKLVNFSGPDEAYIVVAAPDGHVAWQTHGAYSDDAEEQLRMAVASVLDKAQP